MLGGMGSSSDTQVRAAYDAAVAEWAAARAAVEADGLIVANEKGRPVPHPAIAVERSASAEMRKWLPEVRRIEAEEHPPAGRGSPGW